MAVDVEQEVDARMPEQVCDASRAEVAAAKERGGEPVPERVRCDRLVLVDQSACFGRVGDLSPLSIEVRAAYLSTTREY